MLSMLLLLLLFFLRFLLLAVVPTGLPDALLDEFYGNFMPIFSHLWEALTDFAVR